MISHEHRCIFVHVPRCAGTSIEAWITGRDWWEVEPSAKHLIASQARRRYAEHWDAYLKFAFVRDPYERMASCLQMSDHFGLRRGPGGELDLSGYRGYFGHDVVVEFDHRFAKREEVLQPGHRPGQVYGNMLDEPLDFVGRFESLEDDVSELARRLGLRRRFGERRMASQARPDPAGFPLKTLREITQLFEHDFERFGYARHPSV